MDWQPQGQAPAPVRVLPDAVAAQIAKIKSAIESGGCSYTAGSGASVYGGVSDASYSGYGDAAEYVSVVDPAFERRLVEALQKNFNYIKRKDEEAMQRMLNGESGVGAGAGVGKDRAHRGAGSAPSRLGKGCRLVIRGPRNSVMCSSRISYNR